MISKKTLLGSTVGFLSVALLAQWSQAQESRGFRYNNLSVSPFVNLEYTYDSNVNYAEQDEEDDHIFSVHPGVDLNYKGNDWGLNATVWYRRDFYQDNDRLDEDSYGESMDFFWESPKGLSVMLGQTFTLSSQSDSLTDDSGGNGLWRDRNQFDITAAVSYDFSEKTSATVHGMYSDLWYDRDQDEYGALYGWEEVSVGMELARQLTAKSDLILSGSYQEYYSDGAKNGVSSDSTGYTLMAGFGSRATERIRYRLLAGTSFFDYAEGDELNGFVYNGSVSWMISRRLSATFAGSSQFQPSEREANQATQNYTASAGLSYKATRRLTTSFDLAYRREENEYEYNYGNGVSSSGHDDRYSVRLLARYKLKKYASLYAGIEYEDQVSEEETDEFDRYRGTLGLNLRY
ncbi:MAG: outer membrane beta-barrel protein [Kiritimatiellia bacterium]